MDVTLRPATPRDAEFLYELHCRTMRPVIEQTWGWNEAWQREEFERRVARHQPSIIERDGAAVGGLLLEWLPHAVYIHEIQVRPEHQGQGIGTAAIRLVVEEAARRGVDVTLSVVEANPRAKRLYERLGFVVTAFEQPFFRMQLRLR